MLGIRDILREKQIEKVFEGIAKGEIKIGQGLNQEMALKRLGDTHWSSHYDKKFSEVSGIGGHGRWLLQESILFFIWYTFLIKLSLILPVAEAKWKELFLQ
ncbi:uncharacterized protein LOC110640077 [Hevea brasiliensis]|uniref:uncharacterized protein LOC110640077 n=1 Tax=Hevea brasiliensis TaxID=3981 RepID=UPI0025FD7530|nr:uncharacterized protein LOC110640077 [Hevea brasiliensis]XP_057995651.1 uncharacterized protein LOC110640077 [Hevea brasiliensis]